MNNFVTYGLTIAASYLLARIINNVGHRPNLRLVSVDRMTAYRSAIQEYNNSKDKNSENLLINQLDDLAKLNDSQLNEILVEAARYGCDNLIRKLDSDTLLKVDMAMFVDAIVKFSSHEILNHFRIVTNRMLDILLPIRKSKHHLVADKIREFELALVTNADSYANTNIMRWILYNINHDKINKYIPLQGIHNMYQSLNTEVKDVTWNLILEWSKTRGIDPQKVFIREYEEATLNNNVTLLEYIESVQNDISMILFTQEEVFDKITKSINKNSPTTTDFWLKYNDKYFGKHITILDCVVYELCWRNNVDVLGTLYAYNAKHDYEVFSLKKIHECVNTGFRPLVSKWFYDNDLLSVINKKMSLPKKEEF